MPQISVILPTYNPDPERLRRTLRGLRAQDLPAAEWELFIVDNASTRFPDAAFWREHLPENGAVVREPQLGLTSARTRGLLSARGAIALFVDDDNVLEPHYLSRVVAHFAADAKLGAAGGKSLPEFAVTPPAWTTEFHPLLALRDLGDVPLRAESLRPAGATQNEYPACAPIGAGMALRRPAWAAWLASLNSATTSDRRGDALTSGGDNDIIFQVLRAGWAIGYFPDLVLTHLIPAGRLAPDYLARLNRGIQTSWMQVLSRHDANPWPALSRPSATLRKLRAWFSLRAWSSPAARIRWQGACGHFDGRVRS